jgi:1-hydroxy-2-naphthoate dioxygenase
MERADLDQRLAGKNLQGFWAMERSLHGERKPKPYLWKWDDIQEALELAAEHVPMDQTGRRAIVLRNPTVEGGITDTLNVSIQLVKPGEIAKAHRHVASAIRFIIQGSPQACTIVEGERFAMEEGDLVTTPNWTWHDHYNGSDKPVVWLDGLDARLVRFLHVGFSEGYHHERQVVEKPDGRMDRLMGYARPSWLKSESVTPPFRYRWAEISPALTALKESEGDPFDGIRLQYIDPTNGGPTLLTFSCEIQLLRPREKLRPHRHTSSVVYQVFRGTGATTVEGENLSWERKDVFTIPPWQWHSHENRSGEDAVLFSITDWPALKALGFYREEAES